MSEPIRLYPSRSPARAEAITWFRRTVREQFPGLRKSVVDALAGKIERSGRIEKSMWDAIREARDHWIRGQGLTPKGASPQLPPVERAALIRQAKRMEYEYPIKWTGRAEAVTSRSRQAPPVQEVLHG